MSKRRVILVLGSGATLGSDFKVSWEGELWQPPMDRNFFATPLVRALFNGDKHPALYWYQRSPSLEETWSIVDLHHKLALGEVTSEEEVWQRCSESMRRRADTDPSYSLKLVRESSLWRVPAMAGWEIRDLVSQTYREIRLPEQNNSPLGTIIQAVYRPDILNGIVSFNYDTSVEQLLKDQFFYVVSGRPAERSEEKIPLYKLHGSLNWKETIEGVEPTDLLDPVKMTFRPDGSWEQPAIIGPTLFKQEVAVDFQTNKSALFYKRLWRMCWDALQETDVLVFIGFSFPPTDFHVRALFESVHRVRRFDKVLMCTKGDEDAFRKAENIFSGATVIPFRGGIAEMAERVGEVVGLLARIP